MAAIVVLAGAIALARSPAHVRGDHAVDLARELDIADRYVETGRLDLGTREAHDALLDGWSVDERWAGKETFVWGVGESSAVRVWRFRPRRVGLRMRCLALGPLPPGGQRLTVLVNGAPAGTVTVGESFATHEVALPDGAWRIGENELRFRYSHVGEPFSGAAGPEGRRLAVAWDWLELAPSTPHQAEPPVARSDGDATTLLMPVWQRVDIFVELRPGARLRWDALDASDGGRGELVVDVSWELEGSGLAGYRRVRLPVGSAAGETSLATPGLARARIALTALGGPAAPTSELRWRGVRLEPGAAKAVAARPDDRPSPRSGALAKPPRGIVVYLIDTLRADHLGVYGYTRDVSPRIDAFATGATVFERAYAQSGWTRSAVASLFTGLPPQAHGVLDRWDGLGSDMPVLAELLRGAGYETLGVSTNTNVSAAFGFGRGFDTFVSLPPEPAGNAASALEVNRRLWRWLDAGAGRSRFFAYLHTSEPHDPYRAPSPFRGRYAPAHPPLERPPEAAAQAALLAAQPTVGLPGLRRDLVGLYDEEIAANDYAFGELVAGLRRRGLFDDSLVVVLADHGEEFLDHGGWGHGHTLYRELLHVPLLVKLPAGNRARRRVTDVVQQVDVLPSLLEAVGATVPPGAGASLLRSMRGEVGVRASFDGRMVGSYLDLDGNRVSSLIDERLHLLASSTGLGPRRIQLFDLAADPGEQRDRSAAVPIAVGFLRSRLRSGDRSWPVRRAAPVRVDDLTLAELRALGYVR
jgi:arylsulfatase A-like enzyme